MPYNKGSTPEPLKGKGIPQHFVDIFIAVFNKTDGPEEDRFKAAYGAMNKALRDAGYTRADGKWRKEGIMRTLDGLFETRNLERTDDGRFRFELMALRDNALSGNNRFYSSKFIDESIKKTNEWVEQGHVVTIYVSHAAALGDITSVGPDKLPVGKVENWRHERGEMVGDGVISPTAEGRDVMTLIEDGVMRPMSIRSHEYESKRVKMAIGEDEMDVENMAWAILSGVDFCDRPGIEGAGIKVLESAPPILMEDNMEWNEITVEGLKEHCPDLVSELVLERLDVMSAQLEAKDAEIEGLKEANPAEIEDLESKVEALVSERDAISQKLSLYESASTPIVKEIVKRLEENPDADLKEVREAVIHEITTEFGLNDRSDTSPTENVDVGDEDSEDLPEAPRRLAEEMFGISALLGGR